MNYSKILRTQSNDSITFGFYGLEDIKHNDLMKKITKSIQGFALLCFFMFVSAFASIFDFSSLLGALVCIMSLVVGLKILQSLQKLTLLRMGGAKTSPSMFFPITSTDIRIKPQKFLTFSFHSFTALVQNFNSIPKDSAKLLNLNHKYPS